MKLTNEQFTEVAFIFEKENGNTHSDFEKGIIAESKFKNFESSELEQIIVNGLNSGIYKNEDERVSGYWALSKICNQNLIAEYKKWLRKELENENGIAVFQILIGLDRLDEPAFNKNRSGRGADEMELNFRDAKQYLINKNSAQQRV
ncbi:hypothetical protein H8K90_11305 [Winogradskyella echinorum]|uniref:Uncharacterized protein n=1 Tax=Winogradskyella echinorum TaxID=538189 RepID=A0ABR6Y2J3_9FLAO|nr:hypothetical protein [Winogradskyella echinorum]MBC3846969.1 hypothetical protein [Winogradskyella echinorum]MBC5751317.1 hypothetical protein [Winogradskyella echinorum]